MNGFWRTSIFTSGSGIRAPHTEVTNNVNTAFHKKNLMLLGLERNPYKSRETASDFIELKTYVNA
jgi:hypothetical protein